MRFQSSCALHIFCIVLVDPFKDTPSFWGISIGLQRDSFDTMCLPKLKLFTVEIGGNQNIVYSRTSMEFDTLFPRKAPFLLPLFFSRLVPARDRPPLLPRFGVAETAGRHLRAPGRGLRVAVPEEHLRLSGRVSCLLLLLLYCCFLFVFFFFCLVFGPPPKKRGSCVFLG